MKKLLRKLRSILLLVVVVVAAGTAVFAFAIFTREPLSAVPSTKHASMDRNKCVECHAPIAEEWRQSYHFKSLTGPMYKDVREMGYLKIFDRVRKPCLNCHAPANVLDLPHNADDSGENQRLGVECTPNLLKNAEGIVPAVRTDNPEMGVDCVACHLSRRGIVGAGGRPTDVHETVADARFQDPLITSGELCITCHGSAVHAWQKSRYASDKVSCLDCHMPLVKAPSVAGGPERLRRSHRFPADKDLSMLRKALEASIEVTPARKAVVRIKNRGVGHYLPSGGNWLFIYFTVYDAAGKVLSQERQGLGKEEALFLDFWPFAGDTRIAPGMQGEVSIPLLTSGHGRVEAIVRYHDWMRINPELLKLEKAF